MDIGVDSVSSFDLLIFVVDVVFCTSKKRWNQDKENISPLMPTMLARSRMDPNRNEEEGAQGRPLAQWAYHEFHGKIAQVQ